MHGNLLTSEWSSFRGEGGEDFFSSQLIFCFLDRRIFGAIWRDLRMVCTRKTKTLVSTCVILSGMTNIVCLLYVGWVTNYIASVYVKVQEPISEKKLEEDKGDTLRIIERLDHLENVIKQHIQGTNHLAPACSPSARVQLHPLPLCVGCVCVCRVCRDRRSHRQPGRAGDGRGSLPELGGTLREPPPPAGLGLGPERSSAPCLPAPSPRRVRGEGLETRPAAHLAVFAFLFSF